MTLATIMPAVALLAHLASNWFNTVRKTLARYTVGIAKLLWSDSQIVNTVRFNTASETRILYPGAELVRPSWLVLVTQGTDETAGRNRDSRTVASLMGLLPLE